MSAGKWIAGAALAVVSTVAAMTSGTLWARKAPGPLPATLAEVALTRLDGTPMPWSELEGKVLLVVNVASRCGFTPQYQGLQELWTTYRDRGLVVLGAPCNQFLGQEPGTAEEIQDFCDDNYEVSFPLLQKLDVRGSNQHPLYAYLVSKAGGGVRWNFEKFLVGRSGEVISRHRSQVEPDDPLLRAAIEKALSLQN